MRFSEKQHGGSCCYFAAANAMIATTVLLVVLVCCSSVVGSSTVEEETTTTTTTAITANTTTTIDCNGTYYEAQGKIQFSNGVSISNCIFNDSQVQVLVSTRPPPSTAVIIQNCTFVKSSLFVNGLLTLVRVNSSSFVGGSSLKTQSKAQKVGKVFITNSNFTHNSDYDDRDSNSKVLWIIGADTAVIQGCRFIDNRGSTAVAFNNDFQMTVNTSVFQNNFASIFTENFSQFLHVSQCDFSNRDISLVAGVFDPTSEMPILDIQDCNFFDSRLQYGVIPPVVNMSISRCVFRNNSQIQDTDSYATKGGAVIHSTVRLRVLRVTI